MKHKPSKKQKKANRISEKFLPGLQERLQAMILAKGVVSEH